MAEETKLAPPYDFAVLDSGGALDRSPPRSLIYNIDTGKEIATFDVDDQGQLLAERVCALLNQGYFDV